MKVKEILNKRIVVFIITLFILALIVIISNIVITINETKYLVVDREDLKITYLDGTDKINNNYPMSKERGEKEGKVKRIKIYNSSISPKKYKLVIEALDEENSLAIDKIYYQVNNEEVKILGNIEDGVIYENSLGYKKKDIVSIKVWPGMELIDNNDQGKSVELKFDIVKE